MAQYVEQNDKYIKDFSAAKAKANTAGIDFETYDNFLDKFSGGKYIPGSVDGVRDGFFANHEAKEILKSNDVELGGLTPMTKASYTVKMLQEGKSAKGILDRLAKGDAMKKLMGKGEGKEGEGRVDRDIDKENEINKDRNWKDGVEDELELLDVVDKGLTMPNPKSILMNIETAKSKLGFVKRFRKIVEGSGQIKQTVQAKSIKDLRKASKGLFALPDRMEMAKRIVENNYTTRKSFKYQEECPSIILIEDVSGSMEGRRATMAAATIIAMLEQDTKGLVEIVDVYLMGDYVTKLELKGNKIKDYIVKRNKTHSSGTENQTAITKAAKFLEAEKNAEIIILTDGAFDVHEKLKLEVISTGVKCHALLAYGEAVGIKDLCERTGGMYENLKAPMATSNYEIRL